MVILWNVGCVCPNCGYANSLDFEEEFAFIKKLKDKFNSKKASH